MHDLSWPILQEEEIILMIFGRRYVYIHAVEWNELKGGRTKSCKDIVGLLNITRSEACLST